MMSLRATASLAFRRRDFLLSLLGLAIAACRATDSSSSSTPSTEGLPTMRLKSSVFGANEHIPKKYTCDGANVSPPLAWDAPPPNTQSLVLICDDPDAPGGTWVHWVVYDVPPNTQKFVEGISPKSTLPDGGVQGTNDFRNVGYGGPCPPRGTHRYVFKLYALDTLLNLPSGATKADVETAMQGHILAHAELVGQYARSR